MKYWGKINNPNSRHSVYMYIGSQNVDATTETYIVSSEI